MRKSNNIRPFYQATSRLTQRLVQSLAERLTQRLVQSLAARLPQRMVQSLAQRMVQSLAERLVQQRLALLLLALLITACTSDEYVGEQQDDKGAIAFELSASKLTRSEVNLETLVKDFRVYAVNGKFNDDDTWAQAYKVMDSYVVWWNENTASQTTTNTHDWEYVGNYTGSETDVMRSDFTATDDATVAAKNAIAKQSIKYWDHGQPYHIFYGLAKAAKGSFQCDATGRIIGGKLALSALPASRAEGDALFYTDPIVIPQAQYNQPVRMVFKHLLPQIRVGFYETIPGYVVKDVKFYASTGDQSPVTGTDEGKVILLGTFATKGDIAITYNNAPTNANATIACTRTETSTSLMIGLLDYNNNVKENLITGSYLNRSSTPPTYAIGVFGGTDKYSFVMPGNSGPITIKCDYTLVGNDHATEDANDIIHVKGATATIPAEYCKWNSNYTYTYVFKITDNTNGYTGDPTYTAGLYPITFDAVIADDGDNETTTEFVIPPAVTP